MTQSYKRGPAVLVGDVLPVSLFRALADPNRIAVVAWLATQRGSKTVSEIVDSGCCKIDFSVVSRHLHVLRDAGVLVAERHGREVRYHLPVRALASTLRRIADAIDRCCKE